MITKENALSFLQALGYSGEVSDGWVSSSCPLAKYTHKNGTDNKPSFGINLESGQFNCFSCHSGSLYQLLLELTHYGFDVEPIKLAHKVLANIEAEVQPLPPFTEFYKHKHPPFEAWPEYWLDFYTPALNISIAADYLLNTRGLTKAEVITHNLRFDTTRNMVVFPFRNAYGALAGARGRAIVPDGLQHYDYTFNKVNNTKMTWFNEQALTLDKPVIVVEGQMDCIKMLRHYPAVVAGLTAKPTPEKARKLLQVPMVILLLDNDEAGLAARSRFAKLLSDSANGFSIPVAAVDLPEGVKDPDKAPDDWIKNILLELNLT